MIDKLIKFLQKFEKEETFDINQLYIGELGKMHMTLRYLDAMGTAEKSATFRPDRFVIMREATPKEKTNDFKQKYGTDFGNINWRDAPDFIDKNHGITCYKVLLTDKIVPLINTNAIVATHTKTGIYEVVFNSKPLRNFLNQSGIPFNNSLDLKQITNLEDIINQSLISLEH